MFLSFGELHWGAPSTMLKTISLTFFNTCGQDLKENLKLSAENAIDYLVSGNFPNKFIIKDGVKTEAKVSSPEFL